MVHILLPYMVFLPICQCAPLPDSDPSLAGRAVRAGATRGGPILSSTTPKKTTEQRETNNRKPNNGFLLPFPLSRSCLRFSPFFLSPSPGLLAGPPLRTWNRSGRSSIGKFCENHVYGAGFEPIAKNPGRHRRLEDAQPRARSIMPREPSASLMRPCPAQAITHSRRSCGPHASPEWQQEFRNHDHRRVGGPPPSRERQVIIPAKQWHPR